MPDILNQINGRYMPGEEHGIFYQQFLNTMGIAPSSQYTGQFEVTPTDPVSKSVTINTGVMTHPVAFDRSDNYVWSVKTTDEVLAVPDAAAQSYIGAVVRYTDFTSPSNTDGTGNVSHVFVQGAEAEEPVAPTDAEIKTELGLNVAPGNGYAVRLANVTVKFPSVSIQAADIEDTRPYMFLNASIVGAKYGENGVGHLDSSNNRIRITKQVDQDVMFYISIDENGTEKVEHADVYYGSDYLDNINYAFTLSDSVRLMGDTGTVFKPDTINMRLRDNLSLTAVTDGIEISDEEMETGSGGAGGNSIAMIQLWEGVNIEGITLRPTGVAERCMYGNRNLGQPIGSVTMHNIRMFDVVNVEHAILLSDVGVIGGDWHVNSVFMSGGGQVQADTQFGFHIKGLVNSSFTNCGFNGGGGVGFFGTDVERLNVNGNFHNGGNGASVKFNDATDPFARHISLSGTADFIDWNPGGNWNTKAGLAHA